MSWDKYSGALSTGDVSKNYVKRCFFKDMKNICLLALSDYSVKMVSI